MKHVFIIGNWKSNKTIKETEQWFTDVSALLEAKENTPEHIHIVLCVPFTVLHASKQHIKTLNLPYKVGAQNISPFSQGSYTGEIHGQQIKEAADYVIIGHTERRDYFKETQEHLKQKVDRAKESHLTTLYCINNPTEFIPSNVDIVSFEPKSAIGTGMAMDPIDANKAAETIKKRFPHVLVIYGGSVNADNVTQFLSQSHIDGVLPGKASLEPKEFFSIIEKVSEMNE